MKCTFFKYYNIEKIYKVTNYYKSMENNKNLSELINSLEEECKNQIEIKESFQLAINKTKE